MEDYNKYEASERPFIENDYEAERAIKEIKKLATERDRLAGIIAQEKQELLARETEIYQNYDEKIARQTEYLTMFLDNVNPDNLHKTKTQEKYKLVSGEIIRTKAKLDFKLDRKLLAENQELRNYVEYEPKLKWSELKKTLKITDNGKIINEDGEVVAYDGLETVEIPAEVKVKIL